MTHISFAIPKLFPNDPEAVGNLVLYDWWYDTRKWPIAGPRTLCVV
jgi:hypothetical protein